MSPRRTEHPLVARDFVLSSIAVIVLCAVSAEPSAQSPPLTASEARGKKIYLTGVSPVGSSITSYFGKDRLELPGEASTCGSCHGHDGTGRPESGILPTNITWKYLTKSYGHIHESALKHDPFTAEDLKIYLRTGVYPGGARGDPSMPTYDISDDDLGDLVAYLRQLGEELDPGLSETSIRMGTLIPSEGPLAETGEAIRITLEAYFGGLNRAGGIYGRRLELAVHEVAPDTVSAKRGVEAWLEQATPFAMIGTFTPGADREMASFLSEQGIPIIGPLTLYSVETFTSNRQVFYVFSGLSDQVGSLVRFAEEHLKLEAPTLGILYPDLPALTEIIAVVERASRSAGWQTVRHPFSPGAFDASVSVQQLREASVGVVLSLAAEKDLRLFLDMSAERDWSPYVLASGSLSGSLLSDAPASFRRRLYLAYPTLPADRNPDTFRELAALMEDGGLSRAHLHAMISAFSAAKILVEALRRSGRGLDRKSLTAQLEKFYQFETGLTPPITYTANRRVGAKGAYVLWAGPDTDGGVPHRTAWIDSP